MGEKASSEEGKRNEIAQMKEKKEKIDSAKDKANRAAQSEGVAKAKAEGDKREAIAHNRSLNASVAEKIAQANSDTWANTLKKDKQEVARAEQCAKSQVEKAKAEAEAKKTKKAKTEKKDKDSEKKVDAKIVKKAKKEKAKEKLEEEKAKCAFAKQESAAQGEEAMEKEKEVEK